MKSQLIPIQPSISQLIVTQRQQSSRRLTIPDFSHNNFLTSPSVFVSVRLEKHRVGRCCRYENQVCCAGHCWGLVVPTPPSKSFLCCFSSALTQEAGEGITLETTKTKPPARRDVKASAEEKLCVWNCECVHEWMVDNLTNEIIAALGLFGFWVFDQHGRIREGV